MLESNTEKLLWNSERRNQKEKHSTWKQNEMKCFASDIWIRSADIKSVNS